MDKEFEQWAVKQPEQRQPMNNVELKRKVYSVVNNILKEKIYISPVDVLMGVGILSVKDYESWRFGHVPYLEKVCKCNLSKLSFIMRELRTYARQNHLKSSWTAYKQWGVKPAYTDASADH